MSKSRSGIVHESALEALGVIRDVMDGMRTEQLGDRAVLAQYAQHRGNPAAILEFTAQRIGDQVPTPEQLVTEATRYIGEMEKLWNKNQGGK